VVLLVNTAGLRVESEARDTLRLDEPKDERNRVPG